MPCYSRTPERLLTFTLQYVLDRKVPRGLSQATLSLSPWLYTTSFFSAYIKDALHIPSLPTTLPEFLGRYDLLQLVKPPIIIKVWIELEYTHDMSRATQGAVTEHLQTVKWKSWNLF
jgi:hypothetical protein